MFAEKRQKQQPSLAGWGFRPVGVGSPAEQTSRNLGISIVGEYMLPKKKGVVLVLYNTPPVFLKSISACFQPGLFDLFGDGSKIKEKNCFR